MGAYRSIRDEIRAALAAVFGRQKPKRRQRPRAQTIETAIRRRPKKSVRLASTSRPRATYKNPVNTGLKRCAPPPAPDAFVAAVVANLPPPRFRKPKTCTVCGERGHNSRRHKEAAAAPPATLGELLGPGDTLAAIVGAATPAGRSPRAGRPTRRLPPPERRVGRSRR